MTNRVFLCDAPVLTKLNHTIIKNRFCRNATYVYHGKAFHPPAQGSSWELIIPDFKIHNISLYVSERVCACKAKKTRNFIGYLFLIYSNMCFNFDWHAHFSKNYRFQSLKRLLRSISYDGHKSQFVIILYILLNRLLSACYHVNCKHY